MTTAEQNLLLLESMIPSNEKLYIWCYSSEGALIASSCPENERNFFSTSFDLFGGREHILEYAKNYENTAPVILGSSLGMQWALSYESDRKRDLIFLIGPVFYTMPTEHQIRKALTQYKYSRERAEWEEKLPDFLPVLPVMSFAVFIRYVMMVHNTLTGQQLGIDALTSPGESAKMAFSSAGERDRTKVYMAERAMLQMVRNGDINYQAALRSSILSSPGVPIQGQDPLRQMKTSIVVFTTLVCRAAIEGGLSPEIAYPLGDAYIQAAEDCRDSGELTILASTMYHEFIYKVHHLRTNPSYSHAVQKCCDYIELSLDRKIRVRDLAALVGYTEYYLTEKFKQETGLSVSSYIRYAKIERAKIILETSDAPVKEISDRLAFNTPNYFIQCFKETTGYSPAQYRKKYRQKS